MTKSPTDISKSSTRKKHAELLVARAKREVSVRPSAQSAMLIRDLIKTVQELLDDLDYQP